MQSLITGVGFIGGGAILKNDGTVQGTVTAGGLTGCNTIEGTGQDIENAGDAIGDEAREHK